MFAKQGGNQLIAGSVVNKATRIVRESGQAMSYADCLIQAGDDEDVFIGQALPQGTKIIPDQTIIEADPVPVEVSSAQVKAQAARRLKYTDWYVVRAAEDDTKPVPAEVATERSTIRTRCAEIEQMKPIPAAYRAPERRIAHETGLSAFVKGFEQGILIRTTGDIIAMSPPLIVEILALTRSH